MNPVTNEASGLQTELRKLPQDVRADNRVRRLEHLLASLTTANDVWGAGGVERITEQTQALFAAVHELAAAAGARDDDPAQLETAIARVDRLTSELQSLTLPHLLIRILASENDLRELQARVQRDLTANNNRQAQLHRAADEQLRELKEQAGKAKQAVNELVELGTKGLVAKRAGVFDEARKGHRNSAMAWTAVASLLATASAAWAWHVGFGSVQLPGNEWSDPNVWRVAVSSAVIAAIGFSTSLFAARMSSAHRHNAVAYGQKANALASYLAFAETAGDNQVRLLLLAKLADTVFVGSDPAFRDAAPTIEHPITAAAFETVKELSPSKRAK